MTIQGQSDFEKVTQTYPKNIQMPLKGLYLNQRLGEISAEIGRSLVITNFLTDQDGVIAKLDENHQYQVPTELKNKSDWRLFQELMAQADVIISGSAYIKRFLALGSQAEDVLFQFEPGKEFAELGIWRLHTGYKKSSPDLAFVVRSLDFQFPDGLIKSGRKIVIFTTNAVANSDKARALSDLGVVVRGSGKIGVDGNQMIDTLGDELGYRVIMMATGPSVLEILLAAKRLDLFYVTEVQRKIPYEDPSNVKTLLEGGKRVNELEEFILSHRYLQEHVVIDDGFHSSQAFLRYDRKDIPIDRQRVKSEEFEKAGRAFAYHA